MAQKRRIFLADPRDLNSHSCHKTTKLRQTDSIYLICEEATKEPLPDYLRDFFSDKQVKAIPIRVYGKALEVCNKL